ncbi:hypothetical protein POL68_21095 [Stigmatella sp. ncwal1]|uniref:Uncharacterized protein n=1 Tax=Stigmatella ashevillensis TaxID=2995309 RepID=A0ABT5DBD3_9BACT|nr:hypothetical protein [Stigmatella ashevillena]
MTRLGLGLALAASPAALAYPPQCMDVCSCASSCDQPCFLGTKRFTCAEEICTDYCFASAQQTSGDSESQEPQEAQESSGDVCTEQAQGSASAET